MADIFKNVVAPDKLLIVGGGRGDGKGIALCTIPFCVYTIQGKGLNDEDVGVDSALRPGCIDFGRSDVFDIVFIADIVVWRAGIVGKTVVDDDIFRDDDAA